MGILLNVYNDMVKQAEESVVAEQIEVLAKYASVASELLQAEFPNNYTKEDVTELADKLIERDIAIESQNEKVAEAVAITEEYVKVAEQLLVQEHGTAFTKEAVVLLADKMMGMDAEEEFNKEAEVIKTQGFLDEFNKQAETNFQSMDELNEAMVSFFKEAGLKEKAVSLLTSAKQSGTRAAVDLSRSAKANWKTMLGGPTGFWGADPTTKERLIAGAKIVGPTVGAAGVVGAGGYALSKKQGE